MPPQIMAAVLVVIGAITIGQGVQILKGKRGLRRGLISGAIEKATSRPEGSPLRNPVAWLRIVIGLAIIVLGVLIYTGVV